MAKNRKRESIDVPTKRELHDAALQLRRGHSSAGRVLAEQRIAQKKRPRSRA